MKTDFDLAIVGSGFAGSLLAQVARRLNRSVILLERGQHPRFAIGESSTPLANQIWEEVARRYELPRLLPLSKWGTWQKTHPELPVGLKRGFSFYAHRAGEPWGPDPDRTRQLLVAASSRDDLSDTHWYRPTLDAFLVREAQELGAEYVDSVDITEVMFAGDQVQLAGKRQGKPVRVNVRWVADATGPGGCLFQRLGLPREDVAAMPRTAAWFSHFTGVRRWDELHASAEPPPYPVDDAALHHLFPGGWVWVLRFNHGITSAGAMVTAEYAQRLGLDPDASAWPRLLNTLPSVAAQFESATPVEPFRHLPELPFRCGAVAGARWALLPHAAGFLDPLMSTGIALSMFGVARLARWLEEDWNRPRSEEGLRLYAEQTRADLDRTSLLLGALYSALDDFTLFRELSLLYFAGVAYAEIGRRLGCVDQREERFLLGHHPTFGPGLETCCQEALRLSRLPEPSSTDRRRLIQNIRQVIDPVDVTGLRRDNRRNWFPVEIEELLESAPRYGLTAEEVTQRLGLRSP